MYIKTPPIQITTVKILQSNATPQNRFATNGGYSGLNRPPPLRVSHVLSPSLPERNRSLLNLGLATTLLRPWLVVSSFSVLNLHQRRDSSTAPLRPFWKQERCFRATPDDALPPGNARLPAAGTQELRLAFGSGRRIPPERGPGVSRLSCSKGWILPARRPSSSVTGGPLSPSFSGGEYRHALYPQGQRSAEEKNQEVSQTYTHITHVPTVLLPVRQETQKTEEEAWRTALYSVG